MRTRNFLQNDKGASAVEFALVAPLFIYLLIALTVYGGWLWLAQGVQSLATEGARAAVGGLDDVERDQLARAAIADGRGGGSVLDPVALDVRVETTRSAISVSVAYPVERHPMMALARLVPSPPPSTITRTATIRVGGY